MTLTPDEWRTLIFVPLVVSVVANLFTPLVQRSLLALLVASIRGLNATATFGVNLRFRQLSEELNLMRSLSSNQAELLAHYRSSAFYLSFGLWALLLSPLLGLIVAAIAAHYGAYLPKPLAQLNQEPTAAFVAAWACVVGAGPIQAAVYAIYLNRRLRQLSENGPALIAKLESKRAKLSVVTEG